MIAFNARVITVFSLENVYALSEQNAFDEALDTIFETFDDAFDSGKFESIDIILSEVDPARLDTHTLIGFLTASYPGKKYLQNRESLISKVRAQLIVAGVSEQCIIKMLKGLQ
jgi:hypothetical protein